MTTSIGRLSLMIGADASGMDPGFSQALKDTEKLKGKLEETVNKTSLGSKLAGGLEKAAGKVGAAFGAFKKYGELVTGKFNTTGEAMSKLGEIAGMIPGPWGAAASAILDVGGKVVDYLQRDLTKAQAMAKQGFMDMATGAKTIEQAVSGIRLEAMTGALDRMVTVQQDLQRGGAATLLASAATFNAERLTDFMAGEQGANTAANHIAASSFRRMMRAQQLFQELQSNELMSGVRRHIAAELASNEMTELSRGAGLRVARRSLSNVVRGEEGSVGSGGGMSAENALRSIMNERFAAQGLRITDLSIERQRELEQQVRRTAAALRAQGAATSMERFAGTAAQANEQMGRQIATFNMTSREAQIYNLELQRRDVLERLSAANVGNLTARERQQLEVNRRQIDQNLENLRVNDRILTQMEMRRQFQTPLESYEDQISRLERLLRAGAIDETTFGRAIAQANSRILGPEQTEHGGGSALFAGTRAAQAAILRNRRRIEAGNPQDEARRLRERIEEMRREQREQTQLQRDLVREMRRAGVLRPMNLGG